MKVPRKPPRKALQRVLGMKVMENTREEDEAVAQVQVRAGAVQPAPTALGGPPPAERAASLAEMAPKWTIFYVKDWRQWSSQVAVMLLIVPILGHLSDQ